MNKLIIEHEDGSINEYEIYEVLKNKYMIQFKLKIEPLSVHNIVKISIDPDDICLFVKIIYNNEIGIYKYYDNEGNNTINMDFFSVIDWGIKKIYNIFKEDFKYG